MLQPDTWHFPYFQHTNAPGMNTIFLKRAFVGLSFFVSIGMLHAQTMEEMKAWSVDEFARKMTDQMSTRASLSPGQVDQVHAVNLKFAGLVMPVVKGDGDHRSKLSAIKGFDNQRSEELEIFLGAEQMRQVRQVQNENRRKMKQRYYERHGSTPPK